MLEDSTPAEVTAAAEAARGAARAFGDPDANPLRIAALDAIADALDAAKTELVALAGAESHLPEGRLNGELTRTTRRRPWPGAGRAGSRLRCCVSSRRRRPGSRR